MKTDLNKKNERLIYLRSRELSVIESSLIVESFIKCIKKGILADFVFNWFNNTFYCYKDLDFKAIRLRDNLEKASKKLEKILITNPGILDKTYKESIKQKEIVNKGINNLNQLIKRGKKKKYEFNGLKKLYLNIRIMFIKFFYYQILPLILEDSFNFSRNDRLMKKYRQILIKWRESTHNTENEIESLFSQFLEISKKNIRVDFIYWTDYEVVNYFKTLKKPSSESLIKRKKNYLFIWKFKQYPPYEINVSEQAQKTAKDLRSLDNINSHELKGMVACKGKEKGKVYIIRKKKDFKKIPLNRIVVVNAIELNDIKILKRKKIKGIVCEEGGVTSHIAIVSREFKIPIIMGVKNATRIIEDGCFVEVDANKGIVKILKRK